MANRQKQVKPKNRDADAIVYTFIAAVVVLCVLVLIYKLLSRGSTLLQTLAVLGILRWVFLGLAVVLAALTVWKYRTGAPKKIRGRLGHLAVAALLAGLSCWAMAAFFLNAVKYLCGFYAVAAVLYLIWLIYKAEFFTICALIAVTGLSLWMMLMVPGSTAAWIALGIGLVCCVVYALFVLAARRGEGRVKLGGMQRRPYIGKTAYGPMLACAPVSAAALIVGALGASFAYYCIIAMVCVAFVYAVYYTVRLM